MDIVSHNVKRISHEDPYAITVCARTGQILIGQHKGRKFAVCSGEGDVQKLVEVPPTTGERIPRLHSERRGQIATATATASELI